METDNPVSRVEQPKTETVTPTVPAAPVLLTKNLLAFERPKAGDESELLETRYLCRGGGLLICGATGIGKSSLAIQLAMLWGIGKGAFGLNPPRPLKTLIVQAENDDGDIAEFRDGVCAGYNFTASDMRQASDNVVIRYETRNRGSMLTSQILRPLCAAHLPDIVILDHALAYLDGDARSAKDVGNFLRTLLDPIIDEFRCGMVILHHTPKPSQDKRNAWADGDFAYAGLGSIEWPGWARAVLFIRDVSKGNVFEVRAPKRGQRLNWKDDKGQPAQLIHIAHCNDKICWRDATSEEVPLSATVKVGPKYSIDDYHSIILHAEGCAIRSADWNTIAKEDFGMGQRTCEKFRAQLRTDHRVYYEASKRLWHIFH